MRGFLEVVARIWVAVHVGLGVLYGVLSAVVWWGGDRAAFDRVLERGDRIEIIAGVWAIVYLLASYGRRWRDA